MPPRASRKKGEGSEPAAKRVKTTKATTKPATKTRGKKGRLSVLPTLPLDLLYEIFAHLGPTDLISLARTSKAFRSVLLSRQSSFLWREVLDASVEEGYPPRPEDMTEPAWAGFFFGGSFCSLCAAKTTLEVCWAQRRRLCKSCAEEKLIPVVKIGFQELMNQETDWSSILSVDQRRPFDKEGLNQYDRNRKIPHAYVDDIKAYETELQRLDEGCDDDSEWERRRAALDTQLETAVQARFAHAQLCMNWESSRTIQRSRELDDTRRDRGKEIVKRLLALGHERQDIVNHRMREHKDFRDPKPLTERIWTRIQPGLVELVEKTHAERLNTELHKRERLRREAVRLEYVEHVLRRVHPSVVPFMPPTDKIYEIFSDAKALIEPDGDVTDELRSSIRDALPAGLPALQRFIDGRGNGFRQGLPSEWLPSQSPTSPPTDPVTTAEQLNVVQIADLDRAAYVTRCGGRHGYTDTRRNRVPIHFGLDALAHFCDRDYEYDQTALHSSRVIGVTCDQACHDTVVHICTLLGLDAETVTPLDLDKLDRAFVCLNCPRDSGGAVFMTWRDAVAHADPDRRQAHVSKRPTFRLATDLEKRYLATHLQRDNRYDLHHEEVWGCMYCSKHLAIRNPGSEWHLGRRDKYMLFDTAKKHLEDDHGRSTAIEGEDLYHKRSSVNISRFVHLLYWGKRDRKRHLGTTEDVVLPSEASDEALQALIAAKEVQNQQDAAAAAAQAAQIWGMWGLGDDDSD
ncbi:hypothetical protein PENSPDRAFT_626872 [Peniophora sp. CONT]|nr:hypothetical protein PENSPDRAFT_626872 [Peniophora sp. CONT]